MADERCPVCLTPAVRVDFYDHHIIVWARRNGDVTEHTHEMSP